MLIRFFKEKKLSLHYFLSSVPFIILFVFVFKTLDFFTQLNTNELQFHVPFHFSDYIL